MSPLERLAQDVSDAAAAGHLTVHGKSPVGTFKEWRLGTGGPLFQWPAGQALPNDLDILMAKTAADRAQQTQVFERLKTARAGLQSVEPNRRVVLEELLGAVQASVEVALNTHEKLPLKEVLVNAFGEVPRDFSPEESLTRWRSAMAQGGKEPGEHAGIAYKEWRGTATSVTPKERAHWIHEVSSELFSHLSFDRTRLNLEFVEANGSMALYGGQGKGKVWLMHPTDKAELIRLVAQETMHQICAWETEQSPHIEGRLRVQGQWGMSALEEGLGSIAEDWAVRFRSEVPMLEATVAFTEHRRRAQAQVFLHTLKGMDPNDLSRILERDWQLSSTTANDLLTKAQIGSTLGPTATFSAPHLIGYAQGPRVVNERLNAGSTIKSLMECSTGPKHIRTI